MIRVTQIGCVLVLLAVVTGRAQTSVGDREALLQFQRAADSYAFAHRQADRRGGQWSAAEGALFTPTVAAAMRSRIHEVQARGGCHLPATGTLGFEVPRVNASTQGTSALPACVVAALPPLPPELEYRTAGVALLLADAHLHIVVDVLHAAFP